MKKVRICVRLPKGWDDLTDAQLYYIYSLCNGAFSYDQIRTYCFFKWTGIRVVGKYGDGWEVSQGKNKGYIKAETIVSAIRELDWVSEIPSIPVRISSIKGAKAADEQLHGFSFGKYLYCDNLYQGFLKTQDHSLLVQMAQLLYDSEKIVLNSPEKTSIFYWWTAVKSLFSKTFSNFLTPVSTDDLVEEGLPLSLKLQEAMNSQIRALTGGDITKNNQILSSDCWDALWELDAKAKEYKEIKSKYGKD